MERSDFYGLTLQQLLKRAADYIADTAVEDDDRALAQAIREASEGGWR